MIDGTLDDEFTSLCILRHATGVAAVETSDGMLLMVEPGGSLHRLNSTAVSIWQLIDGNRPLGGVIAALAQDYSSSIEEITLGIRTLVAQLGASGLIERNG